MNKFILLSIGAVIALGVAAALLLGGESAPPETPTRPATVKKSDAPVAPVISDLPDRGTKALETSTFAGPEDLEEPAAAEAEPAQVYVIGPDGQPVKDAVVQLLRFGEDEGEEGGGQGGGNFGRFMEARAPVTAYREVRTDADGLAPLSPLPRRRFRIEARSGELFGATEFIQGRAPGTEAIAVEAEALVRLAPVKRIAVTVLDSGSGYVGDVRVTAQREGEGNPFGGRGGRRNDGRSERAIEAWTRAEDGRAILEVTSDSVLYDLERLAVQAQLPGQERLSEVAALPASGTTEVTLRTPRSTAVTVELKTADGNLFTQGAALAWFVDPESLDLPEAEGGGGRDAFRNFFERSMTGSRWVEGGRTRIGGFIPGAKVTFTVQPRGRVQEATEVQLASTSAEERATVRVGGSVPTVLLVVVDGAGAPLPETQFQAEVVFDRDRNEEPTNFDPRGNPAQMMRRMANFANQNSPVRTDAEGRIRIPLRPGEPGEIRLQAARGGGGGRGGPGGGRMGRGGGTETADDAPLGRARFESLPEGGEHDLGTLAVSDSALLVSGTVVDPNGTPIAAAQVVLQGEPEPQADTGNGPPGFNMRRGFGGMRANATTDSRGTFRIYGRASGISAFTIEANGGPWLGAPAPVTPGTKDLVITLVAAGALTGSVALNPEVQRNDLSLELMLEGNGTERTERRQIRVGRDLTFQADRLLPGRYTLLARIGRFTSAEVRGIEVIAGETRADPRLQNLSVGMELSLVEVRVIDASSAPLPRARVTLQHPDATDSAFPDEGGRGGRGGRGGPPNPGGPGVFSTVTTNSEGIARGLIRRGDRVDVLVSTDDGTSAKVERATFPLTVQLVRGADVTIRFRPQFPSLEGVDGFRVQLSSPEAEARGGGFFGGQGGRNGGTIRPGAQDTTLRNIAAGTYTLRVFFRGPRAGEGPPTFGTLSLGEITIPAGATTHEVEVQVTPEMLRDAAQAITR